MISTELETGYEALSRGVAVLDRSHMGRVVATGTDALDLINRFSTNETVNLSDGDVVVTALTTNIGRVLELITVVRKSESESLVLTGEGAETTVIDWLDRYNFGEDCALTASTDDTGQLTLCGPDAAKLGIPLPGESRSIQVEIGGVNVDVAQVSGPSLPAYEVWIGDKGEVGAVRDALLGMGAAPASEVAFEALRIERGLPARNSEITEENNPLEAGLEPFVSFTKGCYMGQEVIARLDTYDKVQRGLAGLVPADDAVLSAGDPLNSSGREIGKITSVASSPKSGAQIALGYVRKGYIEPGTTLDTPGGPVNVVALPFNA